MTFDAFETSDGRPVELITFQNGLQTFRSTNANTPVTLGVNTWEPLAYTRTPFTQSNDSDDSNISMTVPGDFPVIAFFSGTPTSNPTLVTIERFHENDPAKQLQILWKGRIVAAPRSGGKAEMLLQPLSAGKEEVPRATYQSLCNVFLFESPGCRLARDDFRHVGTVSSITGNGYNVIIAGLRVQAGVIDTALAAPAGPLSSAELDIYWQGGYILTAAGEIRDIVEGNLSGDPDQVRVILPFRDLSVSDGVSVFAGCDLSMLTCNKKFNNAINHQGFPYVPEVDPANTELPSGSRTSRGGFA